MQMQERSSPDKDYRFGFQGQEAENELYGEGNASFYKYRISDNRLGRFFSIDPLAPKYPHNSPYAFSENVVVNARELEGLERAYVIKSKWFIQEYKAALQITDDVKRNDRIMVLTEAVMNAQMPDNTAAAYYTTKKYLEDANMINISWQENDGVKNTILVHNDYKKIAKDKQQQKIESTEKMSLFTNDSFWDIEPTYSQMDVTEEAVSRIVGNFYDLLYKNPVAFLDVNSIMADKIKFAIEGRLRTQGAGSVFEKQINTDDGGTFYYKLEFNFDDNGKEIWKETKIINGAGPL